MQADARRCQDQPRFTPGWTECLRIALTTAVLLALYSGFLHLTGAHASYGEANTVSNEIKWQRYERVRPPEVVMLGSSMGGRLPIEPVAGPGGRGVNLCLDGSGAALGAALLQEDGVWPPLVLVEANSLSLPTSQNDRTLRAHFRSFHNTLARSLPFCRAENRPVTVVFSRLKEWLDGRRAAGHAPAVPGDADVQRLLGRAGGSPSPPITGALADGWVETIRRFRDHGSQVVLVMLPDGGRDRPQDYALARRLTSEGARFLDVKGAFPEDRFRYTDGLHLIRASGLEIAGLIARGVEAHRGGQ